MLMNTPPHVGEILRELYLEPMEISITQAAKHLGVSRQSLSNLVNEKSGISAEMSIRLAKAFGSSSEYWMNLEKQYELWQAERKNSEIKVTPFKSILELAKSNIGTPHFAV